MFPVASIGQALAVPGASASPSPPPLAPVPPSPPSLVPAKPSHPSAAPVAPPTTYPFPPEPSQSSSTPHVSSSLLAAAPPIPGPSQAFSPIAPYAPGEVITTSLQGSSMTFLTFICLHQKVYSILFNVVELLWSLL